MKKPGSRGPRPTPTEIKKRRGSPRAKYDNPKEPKPPRVSRPKAPRSLTKRAKKAWPKLAELLDGMGLLTEADLGVCERYLESWAIWREAVDFIDEKGLVMPVKKRTETRHPDGTVEFGYEIVGMKEFPQVRVVARFSSVLVAIERELGLTPSARTRIAVEDMPVRGVGRPPGSKKDFEESEERGDISSGPKLKVVG